MNATLNINDTDLAIMEAIRHRVAFQEEQARRDAEARSTALLERQLAAKVKEAPRRNMLDRIGEYMI